MGILMVLQISLPPLFDKEEDRELIANGLRRSRNRFRQFRSRLSQEIEQSNGASCTYFFLGVCNLAHDQWFSIIVLPARVKQRLTSELGKRLDLDIDKILESPKLEVQLSPAELDRRLLELYESVAGSPGGDLLRVISGGSAVAFQQMYIKRNEARKRRKNRIGRSVVFGPFDGDDREENVRTTSQWIQRALRRNLPQKSIPVLDKEKDASKLNMCHSLPRPSRAFALASTSSGTFCPRGQSAATRFSILI